MCVCLDSPAALPTASELSLATLLGVSGVACVCLDMKEACICCVCMSFLGVFPVVTKICRHRMRSGNGMRLGPLRGLGEYGCLLLSIGRHHRYRAQRRYANIEVGLGGIGYQYEKKDNFRYVTWAEG